MNRFKKIAGSVVLAAALTVSSIGIAPAKTPVKAAETAVTIEELTAELNAVGAKIKSIAETSTLKTSSAGTAAIMMAEMPDTPVATVPLELDMDIDAASKVGHGRMPMPSTDVTSMVSGDGQLPYEDLFMDLENSRMYIHDEKSGLDLVSEFPAASYLQGFGIGEGEGNMFTTLLSPQLLTAMKDFVTITKDTTTVNETPCAKVTVKIKLPKGVVSKYMDGMMSKIPDAFKSYTSMMDPKMMENVDVDASFVFYVDAEHTPLKIDENIALNGLSFNGLGINIKMDLVTSFNASTDKLSIPEDRIANAQVAPGYFTKAGDVSVLSSINDKGVSFFMVTGVNNVKAKKMTIPGSVKAFDKSYNVTQAVKDAFKKAKKLKTLIVKNATLKKELKKNPSKYGLSKKVKIK
ncbi:MAG: hypothetical protein J5819_07445 [Eubacterium sp.]|nr:hypothetical protein [Eubacterium sp.]